jgi:hypothetical protein
MSEKLVQEYKQQFGGRNKQVTYLLKYYIFHLFNPKMSLKRVLLKEISLNVHNTYGMLN